MTLAPSLIVADQLVISQLGGQGLLARNPNHHPFDLGKVFPRLERLLEVFLKNRSQRQALDLIRGDSEYTPGLIESRQTGAV